MIILKIKSSESIIIIFRKNNYDFEIIIKKTIVTMIISKLIVIKNIISSTAGKIVLWMYGRTF